MGELNRDAGNLTENVLLLEAPLGGLPGGRELEEAWEWLRRLEAPYRVRKITERRRASVLEDLLRAVRLSRPGVRRAQMDGGWVAKAYVERWRATTSVLVAVGVHGRRSVYALYYERARNCRDGYAPDLTSEAVWVVKQIPEVRAALEEVHENLLASVPGLSEAARGLPVLFADQVERGRVRFLLSPEDVATHVLVEGRLFSLPLPPDSARVREATVFALARILREAGPLRYLRLKEVVGLLEGRPLSEEARELLWVAPSLEGLREL